jgi:hypothetical protein
MAMAEAGYNYSTLAQSLGIGRTSLLRRVNGFSEFTATQLLMLMELLQLKSPWEIYLRK